MKIKALDVAKYILHFSHEIGDLVTNLRLQKLVYYVQAWYLAENNGDALFDEPILAWKYSPVVESVYNFYKKFGYKPIDEDIPEHEVEIPSEISQHIDKVLGRYLEYSAYGLFKCTTQEDPWIEAYKCGDSTIITNESMRDFYRKQQEEMDEILAELESAVSDIE